VRSPWGTTRPSPRVDGKLAKRSIVDVLGESALFGSLSEADRAAIAGRMRRVRFGPGQLVFSRGDPADHIYLVLEGRVRLSILSSDGRELSFDHAGPGDVFGEIATLDGGTRTAGATAISRVEAMALPRSVIQELIGSNAQVSAAAIRFLCLRLRDTNHTLEAIAFHRIEVRLARLMLSALRLRSPAVKGENVPLDLGMSHAELALLVGATRPKVSLALTALEDMGAIARTGSRFSTLQCNTEILESIAEME
jgi:CRP/FNR family transcriptional regulator, cyclic AMP receptor protein